MRYFTWKLKFVWNSLSMIVSRYTSLLLICPRHILTWSLHQLLYLVQVLYWKTFKFGLGHFFRKKKEILAKIWLFSAIGTVNEDIKSKGKFCRPSWSKVTSWYFIKYSFHYKWSKAWLLVMYKTYASCLTSCQTT